MLIGVIVLSLNVTRFIYGSIQTFILEESKLFIRILNAIETLLMCVTLTVLILNYYK